MEGEKSLPIAHCSGAMLVQTVEEALLVRRGRGSRDKAEAEGEGKSDSEKTDSSKFSAFASVPFVSKPDEKLPRLALLSGMTSAEAVAIASYWEQFANSKVPVVAAMRPAMVSRKIGDLILEATLASASASASADESADVSKRSVLDAASIREKVRASVEARRAMRATGPIQIVIPPRDVTGDGASSSSSSAAAAAAAAPTGAGDRNGNGKAAGAGAAAAGAGAEVEKRRAPSAEKVRARGFGNTSNSSSSNSSSRGRSS